MTHPSTGLRALALLLPLTACGGDGGGEAPDADVGNGPTVLMTAQGTSDCGATITAAVTVTDFVLEEPAGQANQEGHGHYHIYLDDATGADYLTVDFDASADVPIPIAAATGPHELRVELANNDHSPIGVSGTAPLEVSANACIAAVMSPTTVAPGGGVTVDVEVGNFILDEPVGQPNQTGHGHYHIYLDNAVGGNYLVSGAQDPIDVTIPATTAAGGHTLRVSISDNGHVPLSPPVETILPFDVQ